MTIHYHRPPDRAQRFHQTLVHESRAGLVSFMPTAGVDAPMVVGGRTVLEPGSPVVWFTFPGAWHDIGRFHTIEGRFTGYYANILTPVEVTPGRGRPGAPDSPDTASADRWRTTDLFLDVFLDPAGGVHLLDGDEFSAAVERGWLDPATARSAETEAGRLVAGAGRGDWPPALVYDWPLERARRAAGSVEDE